MKTLNLQSFVVMLIFLMVYGKPTPPSEKDYRKQIHECAERLNHTTLPDSILVPYDNQLELCGKEFFCLAEQSLEVALRNISNNKIHKEVEHLQRAVHQYNKMKQMNRTHCHLNMNVKRLLQKLVKDIIRCS